MNILIKPRPYICASYLFCYRRYLQPEFCRNTLTFHQFFPENALHTFYLLSVGLQHPVYYPVSYTHLDVYKRQVYTAYGSGMDTSGWICLIIWRRREIKIFISFWSGPGTSQRNAGPDCFPYLKNIRIRPYWPFGREKRRKHFLRKCSRNGTMGKLWGRKKICFGLPFAMMRSTTGIKYIRFWIPGLPAGAWNIRLSLIHI